MDLTTRIILKIGSELQLLRYTLRSHPWFAVLEGYRDSKQGYRTHRHCRGWETNTTSGFRGGQHPGGANICQTPTFLTSVPIAGCADRQPVRFSSSVAWRWENRRVVNETDRLRELSLERTATYKNGYSNITEPKKNDRVGLNRHPESILLCSN